MPNKLSGKVCVSTGTGGRIGREAALTFWLLDRRGRRLCEHPACADAPTDALLVFALYAAAGALPLAGFVLVAIYKRASLSLFVLGGLTGIAQFLDPGIGVIQHDPGKTGGPLVIAVLQTLALWACSAPCGNSQFQVQALDQRERFHG
jgi:hypothetical protein